MSFKPIYKLRDWVNEELLVLDHLYENPRAIRIIEKNYRHLTASHSANALDRLALAQNKVAL